MLPEVLIALKLTKQPIAAGLVAAAVLAAGRAFGCSPPSDHPAITAGAAGAAAVADSTVPLVRVVSLGGRRKALGEQSIVWLSDTHWFTVTYM